MPSETITMLVKFLPTILAAIIILISMLGGLIRGFRKSLILFIHYVISIVVGLVAYFVVTNYIMTGDLNSIVSNISPDFKEANSFLDVMKVLINNYLPDFAGAVKNTYVEQVLLAVGGVAVSLVSGIVCLIIIPMVVKLLLYILYLLFYREGKVKKHKNAEGEEYRPHRLSGMLVGVVRGLVCSVLLVSYVTSIYFIASGGITTNNSEDDTESETSVQILDSLSDVVGFDINAVYKGLKESRTSGIGVLFNAIKIEGKPIDIYYTDLFLTSSFETVKKDVTPEGKLNAYLASNEEVQAEIAKLCIREELTLLVGLVEELLESNIVTIDGSEVTVHYDMIDEKLGEKVDAYIGNSTLLSEVTPLALIGIAESINKGELSIGEDFNGYFSNDVVETLKKLDIIGDIRQLIDVCITAVELIPLDANGNFDFVALTDINTILSFDVDKVVDIFDNLSSIKTITDLVFPVGIGFVVDGMRDSIKEVGINVDELDLKNVNWANEVKNVGQIYKCVSELELDVNRLMNQEINPDTNMSEQLTYILELISDEETTPAFKQKLLNLVDTIFSNDTKLFGQVALVMAKSMLADVEILYEDGSQTPFGEALEDVKNNLNYYTNSDLKADLHNIITSGMDAANLIPLFVETPAGNPEEGEQVNLFEKIYELDTESLRKALLGTYNSLTEEYEGGIYNIRLLNGDLEDEKAVNAMDKLIAGALKTYAQDFIDASVIDSVTDWRNELNALVDAVVKLQEIPNLDQIKVENFESNVFDVLPSTLTLADIDSITEAVSKSVLLTGIVENTITSAINDSGILGESKLREDIKWTDTFNQDGSVKNHGELNALLKSLTIFSDEEKNIDLNDSNSLVNGLGLLIQEASDEDLANPDKASDLLLDNGIYLDCEEVIAISKSEVLMTILSQKISELASSGEGALSIHIPDRLNTSIDANNWVYWSYDNPSNYNYKQGEFAKLALVLYYARNYAVENYEEVVTTAEVENEEVIYYLTVDNLLDSLIKMDKDSTITASVVLHGTISGLLSDRNSDIYDLLVIPETAKQDPTVNDGIEIKKVEIENLLAVIRVLDINLVGNNFDDLSMGVVIDKVGDVDVRKTLCYSQIFSMTTINRLTQIDSIKIPYEYLREDGHGDLNHPVWYPTSYEDDSWEDCELNRMLASIPLLGVTVDSEDSNQLIVPTNIDEILDYLNEDLTNGQKAIEVVFESRVFRTLVSDTILNDDSGLIVVREEALVEEDFQVSKGYYYNIATEEFVGLIEYLKSNDISIYDEETESVNISLQPILNSLKHESSRKFISTSNILSATVVNQLGSAEEFLSIPDDFRTNDEFDALNSNWYPTDIENWEESEIARLLATIVELELSADENNEFIEPDIQDILSSLGRESSLTEPDNDSLTVAYRSLVIKETLKEKVTTANEMIVVRDEAYDNDGYLKVDEVKDIVTLSKKVKDITKINLEEILGLVKKTGEEGKKNRQLFAESNILNITFVDQIVKSGELSIPETYKDEATISPSYDKDWYVLDEDSNNEVSYLLDAIVELDIKATGNEISEPQIQTLLTNLGKEKAATDSSKDSLTVAYRSLVIKETLKEKVTTANEMIVIRDEAYDEDGYLLKDEVSDVITLSKKVPDITKVNLEDILGIIKADGEEGRLNRKLFAESNILNITLVDQIVSSGQFEIPSVLKDDATDYIYDKDWYTRDSSSRSEVAKLIDAIVELDVKATDNEIDTDSVKPTKIMTSLHHESRTSLTPSQALDVTYESLVIKETIADKVSDITEIKARSIAYEKDENGNTTKYFAVDELRILIEFLSLSNINIDGGTDVDAAHIFSLLKDNTPYSETETKADAYVRMISTSNILNGTMVDIIGGDGVPSPNATLIFADWYLNADGTVNKEHEDWYPRFETSDDYKASEIYHLLVAIEELGLEANENNQITTQVDQIIEILNHDSITEPGHKKLDVVYHSDHIAKTVSNRLEKFVSGDLPEVDAYGNTIYDITGHRSSDVIIGIEEVHALLHAVEVLGLSFHDEDNTTKAALSAGSLTSLSAETLHNNFDEVIDSAIIHYYITNILIDQTQDVNGTEHGIITSTYWVDSGSSKNVIVPGVSEVYVEANEIDATLVALIELGITIDNINTIDSSYLYNHFGASVTDTAKRDALIGYVGESAILSKIFSEIIMSNTLIYNGVQLYTGPLTTKPVYEIKTHVEDRPVLTQKDLMKVLSVIQHVA